MTPFRVRRRQKVVEALTELELNEKNALQDQINEDFDGANSEQLDKSSEAGKKKRIWF